MDKLTWYDEDGRLYCRRGYEVALARLASYEALFRPARIEAECCGKTDAQMGICKREVTGRS